jgi:hypothetical protein
MFFQYPRFFALLAFICFGFPHTTVAQDLPTVQELMSAPEFQSAGLAKLTSSELRELNRWLHAYTRMVAEMVTERSKAAESGTADVIETRIDGEFSGWDGETVFRLQNGQVWQQASYAYRYSYKYSPSVLIYRSGSGFRMQVEGVDGTIAVRRLR